MNKKNILILIITVILFIIALTFFLYSNSINKKSTSKEISNTSIVEDNSIEANSKTPYFYDIDENKLNLSEFEDKPQVILLWKSDNAKSYDIIKLFQKYYEQYKNDIHFLAINVNEENIDLNLKENIKAVNFNIPIYFDTDFTLINEFQYTTLPHLIFIDADNTIGKEFVETVTEDAFQANLELMIAQQ